MGEWNGEQISKNFLEFELKSILAIPLGENPSEDTLIWHYSTDRAYSTKSGYWFIRWFKKCKDEASTSKGPPSVWQRSWSLFLPPKVKTFLWRACKNALPTCKGLAIRMPNIEVTCRQCGWKEEDVVYTLIQCPTAQNVWEAMQIEVNLCNQDYHGRFVEWWNFILSNFSNEEACKIGMICWGLWNARNEKYSKGTLAHMGTLLGQLCLIYILSWRPMERQILPSVKLMRAGFLGNGMVGLGAVLRDDKGEVLGAAVHQLNAEWSAQVAEAKAILFGVKVALHGGYDNIIVESDCLQVINFLQKGVSYYSDLAIVINDVLSYCSLFKSLSWSHVKRRGNAVAHIMAKLSPVEIGERCWFGGGPEIINDAVAFD
ncbi:hypothetical protein RDABS01_034686, partial [Bienertia sinuspersici]